MGPVLRAALSFGCFGGLLLACASPTLPLPPPLTPSVAKSMTQGIYVLSSMNGAQPGAFIGIVNPDPQVPLMLRAGGAQADGGGSWTATIGARSGDVVEVWQEIESDQGSESSAYTEVQIP
jgi:hypothetical protein